MSCQQNICLVLLVGIPACGKTFFGTFLQGYLVNSSSVLGSVQFYRVCYDDYTDVRWPQFMVNGDRWKNRRLEVLKDVEKVVLNIRDNNLDKVSSRNVDVFASNIETSALILIDDNMYFRSMRFEYFKLARTHNLGFCQIYYDVTLECAIKYNKMRSLEKQVPDHVIRDIFDKIEPPLASNFWEANTVMMKPYLDYEVDEVLHDLLACIKNALDNPIRNVSSNCTEQSEESRMVNDCNTIHKVDNILKRLTSPLIKLEIAGKNVSDTRTISQRYCSKRLDILKKIKDGRITLGVDVSQSSNAINLNLIEPFLLSLLKN